MYRYHAQSCPSTSLQHWTARPATDFSLSSTNINNLTTTVYRYYEYSKGKILPNSYKNMKLRQIFSFVTRLKTLKSSHFLTLPPLSSKILYEIFSSLSSSLVLYFHDKYRFFHLFNGLITLLTNELEIEYVNKSSMSVLIYFETFSVPSTKHNLRLKKSQKWSKTIISLVRVI